MFLDTEPMVILVLIVLDVAYSIRATGKERISEQEKSGTQVSLGLERLVLESARRAKRSFGLIYAMSKEEVEYTVALPALQKAKKENNLS